MKRIRRAMFALCVPLIWTGCGKNAASPEFKPEISIFGYLWGNEKLDSSHAILVATTEPIMQSYDIKSAGIREAEATLIEASSGRVTVLRDAEDRPGFYFNDSLTISPKTTYRLRVRTGEKELTAVTTVPPPLAVNTLLRRDTVNAVRQKNISRDFPVFISSESPEQIILIEMFCNETFENAQYIHPFDDKHKKPGNRNEYDGGLNGEPRRIMGIARLKELVSPDYPEGTTVIDWYSSMFVFLGSNTLTVSVVDDRIHRYLTSEHPELEGGVEGGIGVFGSLCGEKFRFEVTE